MNNYRKGTLLIGSALLLSLGNVMWVPTTARSVEPGQVASAPEATMMEGCQQMMKQKEKMMAGMQAEDTELDSQLAEMNSAPEDKKMVLLADIVTQLVKQRTVRDASHAKMQEKMMQHMMEHMQMGKESMSQCRMMKDMKGMHKDVDAAPNDDQKEQK